MFKIYTRLVVIACFFTFISCQTYKVKNENTGILSFLDETVVSDSELEKFQDFGGISSIDYLGNNEYIMVCDAASNPRIYKAKIEIEQNKISSFKISEKIEINIPEEHQNKAFDLESMRYDKVNKLYYIGSEGRISANKEGFIMVLDADFEIKKIYNSLKHFTIENSRNNGLFEGLSIDLNHKGFWFVNELPLKSDGSEPGLVNSFSPIRMSYFDLKKEHITKQFAVDLGRISKAPLLPFMVNGVTDILQLNENQFLFLERAYSAGHANKGNNVRIFLIDISEATKVLDIESLKTHKKEIQLVDKKLIFDFKSVKNKLTDKIIDNIEGITFGPKLADGRQSLILISDDNFSSFSEQINQVILLKLNL